MLAYRRLLVLVAVLFIAGAAVRAVRIVIITLDRVPNAVGLTRVPQALAPAGTSAISLMVSRTAQETNLQVLSDGYLTINAGTVCEQHFPLSTLVREGRRLDFSYRTRLTPAGSPEYTLPETLGGLGAVLRAHRLRTGAFGSVNALALLMDAQGTADLADLRRLRATAADLARLQDQLARVDVAAIDLSPMADADLAATLTWLAQLTAALPPGTRMLACSPNPPFDPRFAWPATWAVMAPASAQALYSPSTRRVGFIANTDLATTICAWTGLPARVGIGRACTAQGTTTPAQLLRLDRALHFRAVWRNTVFLSFATLLTGLLGLLAVLALFRRPSPWRSRLLHGLALVIPAGWLAYTCTGLFPTAPGVLAGEFVLGLLLAALIARVAGRYAVPAVWTAAALLTVVFQALVPDWTWFNQVSYLVLLGSRYYGVGNATSGVVTAGALACAVLGADSPRPVVRAVGRVAPWLAACWLFAPFGGADFGMGLAAGIQALALLVLRLPARQRLGWCLGLGGAMVLLLGGMVWLDVAMGRESHVAMLVEAIRTQGLAPLLEIMRRKGMMAWRLLRVADWTYVLVAAFIAILALLRARRGAWQQELPARLLLGAGLIGMLVALLLNDSGIEPASIQGAAMATILFSLAAAPREARPAEVAPACSTVSSST